MSPLMVACALGRRDLAEMLLEASVGAFALLSHLVRLCMASPITRCFTLWLHWS